MREDRYRFRELETFVSVVEAISERGIREMMVVRSQQFNAGREMLSQEFCHTGAMLKVAVMALGPDSAFRCFTCDVYQTTLTRSEISYS